MKKIIRETAEHYNWKETCDGWHFVKKQFFYILSRHETFCQVLF